MRAGRAMQMPGVSIGSDRIGSSSSTADGLPETQVRSFLVIEVLDTRIMMEDDAFDFGTFADRNGRAHRPVVP